MVQRRPRMAAFLSAALLSFSLASAQVCTQDLLPHIPAGMDGFFGQAVDMDATGAIVGAPLDDELATNAGAVEMFRFNGLTGRLDFEGRLNPTGLDEQDRFGNSVAISGDLALVAAPFDDEAGSNFGAVYAFRRVGGLWTLEQKILPPPSMSGSVQFARAVETDGSRIFIGGPSAIAIYIQLGGSWVPVDEIVTDGEDIDLEGSFLASASGVFRFDPLLSIWLQELGFSATNVALNGELVAWVTVSAGLVSIAERNGATGVWAQANAPFSDVGRTALGGVEIIQRKVLVGTRRGSTFNPTYVDVLEENPSWGPSFTIEDVESGGNISSLGQDMAAVGSRVLLGAPSADGGLRGRAFVRDLSCQVVSTIACQQAAFNSTDAHAKLDCIGSDVFADNNVLLRAYLMPEGSFGFFLASRTGGLTITPGTSQGDLCLAGNIGRYVAPGQVMSTGNSGAFELTIDLTAMPTPTANVTAAAGETWLFQAWHRDANPGLVSNFTDAARLRLQ